MTLNLQIERGCKLTVFRSSRLALHRVILSVTWFLAGHCGLGLIRLLSPILIHGSQLARCQWP